jgi:hypothetical protein
MVGSIIGTPEQWKEDPVAAGTYAVLSVGTIFLPEPARPERGPNNLVARGDLPNVDGGSKIDVDSAPDGGAGAVELGADGSAPDGHAPPDSQLRPGCRTTRLSPAAPKRRRSSPTSHGARTGLRGWPPPRHRGRPEYLNMVAMPREMNRGCGDSFGNLEGELRKVTRPGSSCCRRSQHQPPL